MNPTSFKIATWNINSLRVRLPHVLAWISEVKPDLLALQETKIHDGDFPYADIQNAGYDVIASGQKTYNGVAILARHKMENTLTDFPDFDDVARRVLCVTIPTIPLRILNIYVPNGESVDSQKYQYKLHWLHNLSIFLKKELSNYPQMIILGDFNIAPENIDVHDPKFWEGKVLFSERERQALREIFETGFIDCYRQIHPAEKSFSWWDYRMNAFKRNLGLRIDHILANPALAAKCMKCEIDKAERAKERPSDHAPVIAEFHW
jgi:exodeoxyribonuclease-3